MNLKDWFLKKIGGGKDMDIKSGNHISSSPLTRERMEKIIRKREEISGEEFDKGYNLIKKYPKSVSILGSARFGEDSVYYKQARSLASRIVKELGYAIVTGGGPGIMEAASRGAYEAGGASLGFTIELPDEQIVNKYLTEYVQFEYFFTRKTLLFFGAESCVFYPGGFGTFDELFEMITLIQTEKISKTPIILIGKEFWSPFLDLLKQKLAVENNTIDMKDTEIYKIVDSEDEIMEIIKKAPYREE